VIDTKTRAWCRVIATLRQLGLSYRQIARFSGMSKSTLHRLMPAIEAIAAVSSQMGHGDPREPGKEPGAAGPAVPFGAPAPRSTWITNP
jgi:hypothetical protein